MIEQFDLYCAPKWKIGMLGAMFLVGINLGCLTIARLGDVYGRKPIYKLGFFMNLFISIAMLFMRSEVLAYATLVVFGMSITARYYVGYSYNIEMAPKSHQPIVSTLMFLCESLVFICVCLYFMWVSNDWIYLQIPNIGCTILGIAFLYTMPESPRFLLSQHRYEKARAVFGKIAVRNGLKRDVTDYFVFVQKK